MIKKTTLFTRLAIGIIMSAIAVSVGVILIPHSKVNQPAPWVAIVAISLMVLVIAYASLLIPWGEEKPKKKSKK